MILEELMCREMFYKNQGGNIELISIVFSRYLSCIPSAIKIVLEAKCVVFYYHRPITRKFLGQGSFLGIRAPL